MEVAATEGLGTVQVDLSISPDGKLQFLINGVPFHTDYGFPPSPSTNLELIKKQVYAGLGIAHPEESNWQESLPPNPWNENP